METISRHRELLKNNTVVHIACLYTLFIQCVFSALKRKGFNKSLDARWTFIEFCASAAAEGGERRETGFYTNGVKLKCGTGGRGDPPRGKIQQARYILHTLLPQIFNYKRLHYIWITFLFIFSKQIIVPVQVKFRRLFFVEFRAPLFYAYQTFKRGGEEGGSAAVVSTVRTSPRIYSYVHVEPLAYIKTGHIYMNMETRLPPPPPPPLAEMRGGRLKKQAQKKTMKLCAQKQYLFIYQ